MESVNCDVCDSNSFEVLRQDSFNSLDGVTSYPILTCVCNGCGHVYNNPALDQNELSAFYANQKRESFTMSRGESKGLNAADAQLLTQMVGPGNGCKALEIGCYTGYMMKHLCNAGWQLEGLEPNSASAAIARENTGCDVHEAMFEDYQAQHSYDLIFLGGVLEHVKSPTSFLLKINLHLNAGGYAYVRVPNLDDLEYDTAADVFVLEHLHNFTSRSLSNLFAKCGFEPVHFGVHERFPRSFVGIAKKVTDTVAPLATSFTDESLINKEKIRSFNHSVLERRKQLDRKIEPLLQQPRPRVAIYGAGSHTEIILRNTNLDKANIVTILDSNPNKWGDIAFGFQVNDPNKVALDDIDAVVISSRSFQEEIYQAIAHWQEQRVEIVRLYDLDNSRFKHE